MDVLASALPYIQIVLAVLLVGAILLQRTGAGVGGAFGGGGDMSGSFHTRRGLERTLFQVTLVLALLFVGSALLALLI